MRLKLAARGSKLSVGRTRVDGFVPLCQILQGGEAGGHHSVDFVISVAARILSGRTQCAPA